MSELSRPPLVLLPGFLCDRTVWERQIGALSDLAEIRCMEWGPEHHSLQAMAEAVLQWAPANFALAAHSMGGRVAFEVYRMAPERVTRIAVMNTGVDPRPMGAAGEDEERRRRALLQIARSEGMRLMGREWLKGMIPAYRQDDAVLVDAILQMFEQKTPDLFETQMLALLARPDANPVLGQIRCPALVLTGCDDTWSPPQPHREIAGAIRGAKLALIPECGHMSTMERPEDVTAAMRSWLQGK
jgi:pimeloyl-ACP methyl ester carboxylesterase